MIGPQTPTATGQGGARTSGVTSPLVAATDQATGRNPLITEMVMPLHIRKGGGPTRHAIAHRAHTIHFPIADPSRMMASSPSSKASRMTNYRPLLTRLKDMRTALMEKMAAKPESLTFDDIRDLAAVHISVEAVEVEETRENFDTPIGPEGKPEIGPWTDA